MLFRAVSVSLLIDPLNSKRRRRTFKLWFCFIYVKSCRREQWCLGKPGLAPSSLGSASTTLLCCCCRKMCVLCIQANNELQDFKCTWKMPASVRLSFAYIPFTDFKRLGTLLLTLPELHRSTGLAPEIYVIPTAFHTSVEDWDKGSLPCRAATSRSWTLNGPGLIPQVSQYTFLERAFVDLALPTIWPALEAMHSSIPDPGGKPLTRPHLLRHTFRFWAVIQELEFPQSFISLHP